MVFSYILTFVNSICSHSVFDMDMDRDVDMSINRDVDVRVGRDDDVGVDKKTHHYSVLKNYKDDYEQCLRYEPYYMCYQKYKRVVDYRKNISL
jgi:hypothetical protein